MGELEVVFVTQTFCYLFGLVLQEMCLHQVVAEILQKSLPPCSFNFFGHHFGKVSSNSAVIDVDILANDVLGRMMTNGSPMLARKLNCKNAMLT
ncbi:hypothetical protein D918_07842 [Trichuris suis]|nr:hypothetical protein D918_07842 [Trichuris suis]